LSHWLPLAEDRSWHYRCLSRLPP